MKVYEACNEECKESMCTYESQILIAISHGTFQLKNVVEIIMRKRCDKITFFMNEKIIILTNCS
jgi:hypothetical protein